MGFPRQEYWSGLPFPTPEDLPDSGFEPLSPVLQADLFTAELGFLLWVRVGDSPIVSFCMVLATLLAARDWEETAGGHSEHQWLPVEGLQCVDTDRENWKFSSTCFIYETKGFPCGSAGKEYACSERDQGSVPGLGRSPGEGNGYPLLYCGLENSMDCIDWATFTFT